jgi:DNA helicase-2/ATP-dependent DNA helicase PcrA
MDHLSTDRLMLLETNGHLLVLGGPGSGKTTIALLKADKEIHSGVLKGGQQILFLSFARATVARIAQQASRTIVANHRKRLEINTYHGFAWNILRSHGYLLCPPGRIRLLLPPEAASHLVEFSTDQREAEKHRLFNEEALLHFDLFAAKAAELLTRSKSLAKIISDAYPVIILDEFQDTNADEWAMIQACGKNSRLISLADPEQRIYEFRGADPRRISEFSKVFSPTTFDFGHENHRSSGTDIVTFANDLLRDEVSGKDYKNVKIIRYGFYNGTNQLFPAKAAVIRSIKRLRREEVRNWSIAILVPSKRVMLQISDYLSIHADDLPVLRHDVAFDAEGPALAATAIAGLLEFQDDNPSVARRLIENLVRHMRGRNGPDGPSQANLTLSGALTSYLIHGKIMGRTRKAIIDDSIRVTERRAALSLIGQPDADWLAIRNLLAECQTEAFQQIADDAKYLRFLRKGTTLRSRLGDLWRSTGGYAGAVTAVHDALLQEHLSSTTTELRGIYVMTIHKSKGKEFDEVIIYEGRHSGRIVRPSKTEQEIAQARLSLRVAVTRARRNTTILTPVSDPCPFL